MTKQEIISQGYLESYLTGELDSSAALEVEAFLKDPEVRNEYLNIQHLIENLTFQYAIPPSPVLKELILNEVSGEIQDKTTPVNGWKLMLAASVIILLSSVFVAFHFWNKWKTTDEMLSDLTARHNVLAESLEQVNNELGSIQSNLAVLISPEYSRIILNGTENAPDARAVIYWNPQQEKVFLHASSLTTLNQSQQYQLWALVDGKPTDAGVFDPIQDTFVQMKRIDRADAFAVTIEKRGGSTAPTLSTLQVIGNISS